MHVGNDKTVNEGMASDPAAGFDAGRDGGDVPTHQDHVLARADAPREHQLDGRGLQHGVAHLEPRGHARQLDQPKGMNFHALLPHPSISTKLSVTARTAPLMLTALWRSRGKEIGR